MCLDALGLVIVELGEPLAIRAELARCAAPGKPKFYLMAFAAARADARGCSKFWCIVFFVVHGGMK
jgi:hypothetical protein